MSDLHRVTDDELPFLRVWLEKHLPFSHKIYHTVNSILGGRWNGPGFFTLGWPDIRAVGEDIYPENHPCHQFLKTSRGVFSPNPQDLETLLKSPGYIDWTTDNTFRALPPEITKVVESVCRAQPSFHCISASHNIRFHAEPGTLQAISIPENYTLHPLDADDERQVDFVASNWPFCKEGAVSYLRELIRQYPSMGAYDEKGNLVSCEIGTEFGTIGMLFTAEEHRRRRLGSAVSTELAREYHKAGLPVYATVKIENEPSIKMHTDNGFRPSGNLTWLTYRAKGSSP